MNLVLIETKSPGVLELFHYVGKKFQVSVALNLADCPDAQMIKDTVEDFRVQGIKMLA